jgi:hypothetical protein
MTNEISKILTAWTIDTDGTDCDGVPIIVYHFQRMFKLDEDATSKA